MVLTGLLKETHINRFPASEPWNLGTLEPWNLAPMYIGLTSAIGRPRGVSGGFPCQAGVAPG